jgi:hypothetical protein
MQEALLPHPFLPSLQYIPREIEETMAKGFSCTPEVWLHTPDHCLLPGSSQWKKVLPGLYQSSHPGANTLM